MPYDDFNMVTVTVMQTCTCLQAGDPEACPIHRSR